MSISSEISRISGAIAAAYIAAAGKGATMPATPNAGNLADCIGSIPIPKIAWGTVTPEETSRFSTLRIDGIADANGNSFKPTGFALILIDASATTHVFNEAGVVAMVQTSSDGKASRISVYTATEAGEARIRTNQSKISSSNFGDGWFRYTTATSAYYLLPGTWLWVAWATDSEQARGLMSAQPEETGSEEER